MGERREVGKKREEREVGERGRERWREGEIEEERRGDEVNEYKTLHQHILLILTHHTHLR